MALERSSPAAGTAYNASSDFGTLRRSKPKFFTGANTAGQSNVTIRTILI